MKKIFVVILVVISGVGVALTFLRGEEAENSRYYTNDDFYKVKKIDGHVHIGSDHPGLVEQALQDNFSLLGIITEVPDYPAIDDQENDCISLMEKFPGNFSYLTTFETETILEPGWKERTLWDGHRNMGFCWGRRHPEECPRDMDARLGIFYFRQKANGACCQWEF